MKQLLLITLIVFIGGSSLWAKDKYIWPEFGPVEIPDSVKNEDALYLENRQTIDFNQSYNSSYIQFQRIKILSKKGVEEFIKHDLFEFSNGTISLKKARIIKPDGSILELTDENIIETYIKSKAKKNSGLAKHIQFIFPNLQVNDIIDVVYQYDFEGYNYSDCVFLEDDYYALNARITLRNLSRFNLRVIPSSTLSNYKTTNTDGIPTFYWHVQGVKKNPNNIFSAHAPDAAKIAFNLYPTGLEMEYPRLYGYDLDLYSSSNVGVKSVTNTLIEMGIINPGFGALENINLILKHIEKNCSWNDDPNLPASISSFDLLRKNETNTTHFFKIVQKYLKESNLKYHIGYTCDIRDYYFEPEIVAYYQMNLRFLIIENTDGSEHFLFPPRGLNTVYYLNEIPFYCEGNQAVLFTGDNKEVSTSFFPLPTSNSTVNKNTTTISLNVEDLLQTQMTSTRRDIFSGHQSIYFRNPKDASMFQELCMSDTIYEPIELKDSYPYTLTYKIDDTLKSTITEFDDNLFVFSADSLIPNFVYYEDENTEKPVDYSIVPYTKHQKFTIYLKSNTLLNAADDIKVLNTSNDVGFVKAEIIQTNPNTIKISYEVRIDKRILVNVDESKAFLELTTAWKNTIGKKWIISEQKQ